MSELKLKKDNRDKQYAAGAAAKAAERAKVNIFIFLLIFRVTIQYHYQNICNMSCLYFSTLRRLPNPSPPRPLRMRRSTTT